MTQVISIEGVEIIQKRFQQILLRGDGKDKFNEIVNKEIAMPPPAKNLEIAKNDRYLFAKNSFDQWTLIYLNTQDQKTISQQIFNLNSNDELLATDYSYGQIYFEVYGKNKNEFLNKLTNFDFRSKKFPPFTMAQTLLARVDCSIYNLEDKFLITCNRSFEDYFKERLIDLTSL